MSLPIGRIQCRKHHAYIGAHLPKGYCSACDFIYFMRKKQRYFFSDTTCVEVRKLVLRKKK